VIYLWDVFICHASEDKEAIARPLAEALQKRGLRVWYDEFTLKMGDSLRRTIDRGLDESTYGIVILSTAFFTKEWPQKELDGLDARERDGKKVILPIWHDLTEPDVRKYSPMLAGRLAAQTKDGMRHTVDMVMEVFGENASPVPIENKITDKIVTIQAEKESFIIGQSIEFRGISTNCGDHVILLIFGPGKFSKGFEVAHPEVSHSNNWGFQWIPDNTLLPGYYTITVFDPDKTISDEVMIKAEKGSVSILAQGDGTYFIGEKIKLLGVNTAGKNVFLTLKGPNATRQERRLDRLDIISLDENPETFLKIDVRQDFTWSYVWDTKKNSTLLTEGYYRIFAIESPVSTDNFSRVSSHSFGTVSIMMRPPFISATLSQASFAQGDIVTITGTAEGVQYHEILIWIFGDRNTIVDKINVNPDASYIYQIPRKVSKKLESGQYFAIIHHPMMDDEFDVYFDTEKRYVLSNIPKKGTILFSINGNGSVHGFDAITHLMTALKNQSIDDIYTKLSFHVAPPIIRFDPIENKKKGEKFSVTASTNLAVNDEIFIEIFASAEFSDQNHKPFAISKGIIRIVKGDAGLNKISFDFDTTTIMPAEYIVKASAMDVDTNTSTSFKVIP
jgi:hypothetical protein